MTNTNTNYEDAFNEDVKESLKGVHKMTEMNEDITTEENEMKTSQYTISQPQPQYAVKVKKATEYLDKQKTVYFGAGWFNDGQLKAYNEAQQALKDNPSIDFYNSYVPLDNQYKGINVLEHPEYLHDKEWATATGRGDLMGINTSDIMLGVYLPSQPDEGLGVELGYAYALHKYILIVIPDEEYGNSINLMPWVVADNVIKMSELADYNFNKPKFDFYDGAVF